MPVQLRTLSLDDEVLLVRDRLRGLESDYRRLASTPSAPEFTTEFRDSREQMILEAQEELDRLETELKSAENPNEPRTIEIE